MSSLTVIQPAFRPYPLSVGNIFSATIAVDHSGPRQVVDVAWAILFVGYGDDTYAWALAKDVAIAEHYVKTRVEVTVQGICPRTKYITVGNKVSAVAALLPQGTILKHLVPQYNAWHASYGPEGWKMPGITKGKMTANLSELNAILVTKVENAYMMYYV